MKLNRLGNGSRKTRLFSAALLTAFSGLFSVCQAEGYEHKCDVTPDLGAAARYVSVSGEGNAALIGVDESGKTVWSKTIPVTGMNPAKAQIACHEATIAISWQDPYSAMEHQYQFSWHNEQVVVTSSKVVDESLEALNNAVNKAIDGQGVDWSFDILYPDHYISADGIANLIELGHKRARDAAAKKHYEKASEIMDNTFDLSLVLANEVGWCDECSDDFNSSTSLSDKLLLWNATWQDMELPATVYIGALGDFGAYLMHNKKYNDAVTILASVIGQDSQQTEAYLTLADAYQKEGQRTKARHYYRAYVKLMEEQGMKSKIPKRVIKWL